MSQTADEYRKQFLLKENMESWDDTQLYYSVTMGLYSAFRQHRVASKQWELEFEQADRQDYEQYLQPYHLRWETELAQRIAAGTWPAKELEAAVAVAEGANEYDDSEPEIRTFLLGVAWGRNNPK